MSERWEPEWASRGFACYAAVERAECDLRVGHDGPHLSRPTASRPDRAEPVIECLDGDVFPTVEAMYDHIRLVHIGIDVPDLDPPTGYWCCSFDWNRGTLRTGECIDATNLPEPKWTRVIGVSMNDLHEQGLIARAK